MQIVPDAGFNVYCSWNIKVQCTTSLISGYDNICYDCSNSTVEMLSIYSHLAKNPLNAICRWLNWTLKLLSCLSEVLIFILVMKNIG